MCPETKPGAPRWSTMDLTLCWAPYACACCVFVPLPQCTKKTFTVCRPLLINSFTLKLGALGRWRSWLEMPTPEEIRRAFATFDTDGNGYLSVAELKAILCRPGQAISA